MGLVFEADKDSLEGAFTAAAEAFGKQLAKAHFGEEGMDWTVSGSELWGGEFAFDFTFRTEAADQPGGEEASFQMRILAVRNMEPEPFICTECGCEVEDGEFDRWSADGEDGVICHECAAEGNGCAECARSYGPNYNGPCDH